MYFRCYLFLNFMFSVLDAQDIGLSCVNTVIYGKTAGHTPSVLNTQDRFVLYRAQANTGAALTSFCGSTCRAQNNCTGYSVNYEEKICFGYSLGSQFRSVKADGSNFYQKICLQAVNRVTYERVCPSQPYWSFVMVPNYSLDVPYNRTELGVNSRDDCMALCLLTGTRNTNEPICRSATYSQAARTCALSTETRFTSPKNFRNRPATEYLENQCASRSLGSSCSYKPIENVGVTSIDKLESADDIEQCQEKCDMLKDFVCRSFEFQRGNDGQVSNKCFLSGDNSDTLGGFRTQRFGTLYKERMCVTESCANGIYTYEKMTGVTLRLASVQRQIQVFNDRSAKSAYCLQQCNLDGVKCPAVHFSYRDKMCAILDQNSQGRDENLLNNTQSVSFFEKICLRGTSAQQNCRNKDWSFERVIGFQLSSFLYFTTRNAIQSRRDCEEMCLSSSNCKSALYESDTLACKLSEYTRRTKPNDFVPVPEPRRMKSNYLENACIPAEIRCSYRSFEGTTAVFADFVADNYPNEDACRNLCDTTTSFFCRAYSYLPVLSRCTLSGDDDVSTRQMDTARKVGTIYNRKVCTDNGSTGTTVAPSEGCLNGLSTFEKLSATMLSTAITVRQLAVPLNQQKKIEYCLNQCSLSGKSCPAAQFSYTDSSCRILDQNSDGRSSRLIKSSDVNYFEKVCLPGFTARTKCEGRLWAFQRVVGYQLQANLYFKTETQVQSRQDCEVKCLESSTCKSALYESDTKDCKLSAYTRRSNPGGYNRASNVRSSYISYLENECVPEPTSCSYNKLNDARTSYPDSVFENIFSEDECKRTCESSRSFFCRAYSYQTSQRKCMVSSDDGVTTENNANKPQFGMLYVERVCTSMVPPTTSRPTSSKCGIGETSVMEKTAGFSTNVGQMNELHKGTPNLPGITAVCKIRCSDTNGCDGFVVYYENVPRCSWVKKLDSASSFNLIRRSHTSFFENVCVSSAAVPPGCENRLWAFQRFPFSKLPNVRIKSSFTGVTRVECETRCLKSEEFVCRSILYNNLDKSCQLSDENRRTARQFRLLPDQNSEYIENNCQRDEYTCRYNLQRRSTFMRFATKSLLRIPYLQCLQECDREETFNCLSISYFEDIFGQGTCVLNSEDARTTGEFSLQPRRGTVYNDKVCNFVTPITTTPRPVRCQPGQYSFEKLSGYDVSETHQEMNAIIDSKDLATSCARECMRMDANCDAFVIDYSRKKCLSIISRDRTFTSFPNSNYFSKNLDISYFKKICLPDNTCRSKTWVFDRVLDFFLADNVGKELNNVNSRVECEKACQKEIKFQCASANYLYEAKICQLSAESRRTQPGSFLSRRAVDYLENHCPEDPPTCKYKSLQERFLPFVDKTLKTTSEEQCKISCETDPELPCRSYSWDKIRGECFLSSDDTWSRPEGEQALLTGFNYANYIYGEKGQCEQVKVACDEEAMVISLAFGKTFNGLVYARSKPKDCFITVNGESQVSLTLPLGSKCGTVAETRVRYVNEVIVQKHPIIQTVNDKHIKVICTFDRAEQVLTYGSRGLGREGDFQVTTPALQPMTAVVTNSVPPPPLRMLIVDQNGQEGHVVGLGEPLTLRIEFQNPRTTLGIFTRNLTATTLDGDMMVLIDIDGCPTETNIFPALQYDPRDKKSQFATFKAFRFRSSGYITFRAQIHFCQDACQPAQCRENIESVGRRRRNFPTELFTVDSESDGGDLGSGDEDLFNATTPLEDAMAGKISKNTEQSEQISEDTDSSAEQRYAETVAKEEELMFVPNSTDDGKFNENNVTASSILNTLSSDQPLNVTESLESATSEALTDKAELPIAPTVESQLKSDFVVTNPTPSKLRKMIATAARMPATVPKIHSHENSLRLDWTDNSVYNSPKEFYSAAEKKTPITMPAETPLTYSLLVNPDKNDYLAEDRAEGAAHVGIAPTRGFSETFSLYENDKICSDRTTVIASVTTVTLIHLIVIIAGVLYYRHRKKRRNKNLDYEYTAGPPLPKRNNQSAGNSGILARPNMTFRNIYGYTTAPSSSLSNKTSTSAT